MDLSIMKINGKYHMDRNVILLKYKTAASTVIGERRHRDWREAECR
jgi:hypothetical protein